MFGLAEFRQHRTASCSYCPTLFWTRPEPPLFPPCRQASPMQLGIIRARRLLGPNWRPYRSQNPLMDYRSYSLASWIDGWSLCRHHRLESSFLCDRQRRRRLGRCSRLSWAGLDVCWYGSPRHRCEATQQSLRYDGGSHYNLARARGRSGSLSPIAAVRALQFRAPRHAEQF